jgi:hypothetical protein
MPLAPPLAFHPAGTPAEALPSGRVSGVQRFFDRQGAVHARISVDFAREFGCLLEAQIHRLDR